MARYGELEDDVQAIIGRAIFAKLGGAWSGEFLDFCAKDEAFELEMFRFVRASRFKPI